MSKYPPTKCIAVDVDGTLQINGRLNRKLAEWAKEKRAEGYELILWSARGREHAERVAEEHGVADHFTSIVSKPGYIVDDQGWGWVKFTKVLRNLL